MQPEAHRQRRMVTEWTAKPHIVLWLVDDQGWANAGWNNQHVYTPRMDTMAKEGIILNRHYSYPWCAPSRAALMTGRMPHDGFENMGQIIPQDVDMLSHAMKEAGYSTHHVGKWHLGLLHAWESPAARGFDSSLGFMGGSVDYVTQVPAGDDWACNGIDLQRNGGPADGVNGTFSGHWFAKEIDRVLLNRSSAAPVFLFVALQAMHTPLPDTEVLAQYAKHYEELGYERSFTESSALVTHADDLLGHINGTLHDAGMWYNTLLVHLSDNGGQVTNYGDADSPGYHMEVQGNNWPLRGMKKSFFEGGVRTPAFLAGGALPLYNRGSTLQGYIHLADWFATLREIASSPHHSPEGGLSMAAYIAGREAESPRKSMILGAGATGDTVNPRPYNPTPMTRCTRH